MVNLKRPSISLLILSFMVRAVPSKYLGGIDWSTRVAPPRVRFISKPENDAMFVCLEGDAGASGDVKTEIAKKIMVSYGGEPLKVLLKDSLNFSKPGIDASLFESPITNIEPFLLGGLVFSLENCPDRLFAVSGALRDAGQILVSDPILDGNSEPVGGIVALASGKGVTAIVKGRNGRLEDGGIVLLGLEKCEPDGEDKKFPYRFFQFTNKEGTAPFFAPMSDATGAVFLDGEGRFAGGFLPDYLPSRNINVCLNPFLRALFGTVPVAALSEGDLACSIAIFDTIGGGGDVPSFRPAVFDAKNRVWCEDSLVLVRGPNKGAKISSLCFLDASTRRGYVIVGGTTCVLEGEGGHDGIRRIEVIPINTSSHEPLRRGTLEGEQTMDLMPGLKDALLAMDLAGLEHSDLLNDKIVGIQAVADTIFVGVSGLKDGSAILTSRPIFGLDGSIVAFQKWKRIPVKGLQLINFYPDMRSGDLYVSGMNGTGELAFYKTAWTNAGLPSANPEGARTPLAKFLWDTASSEEGELKLPPKVIESLDIGGVGKSDLVLGVSKNGLEALVLPYAMCVDNDGRVEGFRLAPLLTADFDLNSLERITACSCRGFAPESFVVALDKRIHIFRPSQECLDLDGGKDWLGRMVTTVCELPFAPQAICECGGSLYMASGGSIFRFSVDKLTEGKIYDLPEMEGFISKLTEFEGEFVSGLFQMEGGIIAWTNRQISLFVDGSGTLLEKSKTFMIPSNALLYSLSCNPSIDGTTAQLDAIIRAKNGKYEMVSRFFVSTQDNGSLGIVNDISGGGEIPFLIGTGWEGHSFSGGVKYFYPDCLAYLIGNDGEPGFLGGLVWNGSVLSNKKAILRPSNSEKLGKVINAFRLNSNGALVVCCAGGFLIND